MLWSEGNTLLLSAPSGQWFPNSAVPEHPLEPKQKKVPGIIHVDSDADLQMDDFSKLSMILRYSHTWDHTPVMLSEHGLLSLCTWSWLLLRLDLRPGILFYSLLSQCKTHAGCAGEQEPGSQFCCSFPFREDVELFLLCKVPQKNCSLLQMVLLAGPLFVTVMHLQMPGEVGVSRIQELPQELCFWILVSSFGRDWLLCCVCVFPGLTAWKLLVYPWKT